MGATGRLLPSRAAGHRPVRLPLPLATLNLLVFPSPRTAGLPQAVQQHQQSQDPPATPLRRETLPMQGVPRQVHPVRAPEAPQAPTHPGAAPQVRPLPQELHPSLQPQGPPEGELSSGPHHGAASGGPDSNQRRNREV